ncbi:MAG TPA: ABC transporter ATP-binding protein [Mesorhizobium sp.]|jgi:multiple sugar transport system ATP-binding protein|nr:ABC transporter ATP-binding protein [Mesorhizobium sp.]
MARVEYERIGKRYGTVEVMRDIHLVVEDQSFVVLLGPSGCGKTTLLRMTAGLESISEGEVRIGGKRMNEVHPRDRDIAMVFQNYALYPTMKVYDNIAFSLQVKGMAKPEIDKKVRWAADILGLTQYLDRYPKALSGGQRQRVAMGRALVRDPAVFLFDEPLSNLDAKLRGQMRYEIRRIHDRLETTTVYVTHDQIEAMTMADQIVVMRGGVIEQRGAPAEVYDRPASLFVADFIGSPPMNFLRGRVMNGGSGPAIEAGGARFALPQEAVVQEGQEVVVGVRPADITVGIGGDQAAEMVLSENTGAETLLHLNVGGEDVRAVVSGRPVIPKGEAVRFGIDPAKMHVFDAQSGKRL